MTICVTNQPDVARGTLSREVAESINDFVRVQTGLDDLVACFHDSADECSCRKPLPGMLLSSGDRWSLDLASSYMIGDRWRDVDAGKSAGCRTIYLDRGWPERDPAQPPDARVDSLEEAGLWLLSDALHRHG